MQAIATLIHDDPYLTMPREQRIADRARRRLLFRRVILADPLPEPVAEIEPEAAPEEPWIERQKAAWFSVEADLGPVASTAIRVDDIIKAVVARYPVSRNEIRSNSRMAQVVRPRQIAMYLARILTGRSLPEIGRRMGGRDHTTVLHSVGKIRHLITIDQQLASEIDAIKAEIMA